MHKGLVALSSRSLPEAANTSSTSWRRARLAPYHAVRRDTCWDAQLPLLKSRHGFHLFSISIWGFLKPNVLHYHLSLASKMPGNYFRDFSQHPSTWPATLYNITQGYKGDQKPWFYTQDFMKSYILGSIRPLFLETTSEYSETHLELQPVLLLCTHSQLSLVDVQACLLLWS